MGLPEIVTRLIGSIGHRMTSRDECLLLERYVTKTHRAGTLQSFPPAYGIVDNRGGDFVFYNAGLTIGLRGGFCAEAEFFMPGFFSNAYELILINDPSNPMIKRSDIPTARISSDHADPNGIIELISLLDHGKTHAFCSELDDHSRILTFSTYAPDSPIYTKIRTPIKIRSFETMDDYLSSELSITQ